MHSALTTCSIFQQMSLTGMLGPLLRTSGDSIWWTKSGLPNGVGLYRKIQVTKVPTHMLNWP
jgi:hypothetical protein